MKLLLAVQDKKKTHFREFECWDRIHLKQFGMAPTEYAGKKAKVTL